MADSSNSPCELISVLSTSLNARPSGTHSARDILRLLVPHMNLIPARTTRDLYRSFKIIFWNACPVSFDIKPGSFSTRIYFPKFLQDLLCVFLPSIRMFGILHTLETSTPTTKSPDSLEIWDQNRYSSLINQPLKAVFFF